MDIRKATIEDMASLIELRKKQLIDEGSVPNQNIDTELNSFFTKHIVENSLVEWVAEEDGAIIATGAIVFYEFPPSFNNKSGIKGYVTNMYTVPAYRKQGLAKQMLDKIFQEAMERNVDNIFLHASKMGRPVYLKYGFKETDAFLEYH